ncbi:manganese efflux pump MntP family protein [Desulfobacter sp.]|jgi:putative Mn2+ efflux pump MntP|uniref:manganese efflux pump MntP n=1 Tax=Desulfobacter sp. TaxID=2294 RepID=UPI001B6C4408|nr:manganese efflux pump MntP family protein [Desulfobacter sp.]MBP8828426.1 manganese efflux pump [Desulfobacter sp.]HRF89485.1 manganese efflux pump MntP family protein [Desulfobacter postgatei]
MHLFDIFVISIGLAMDASAVSMAAAACGYAQGPRAVFRLAFHFGLFQFMMPVVGWFLGTVFVSYVRAVDHWIAFGLLVFVGGRMVWEGFSHAEECLHRDPSKGFTMVMLSVATSIDALAIGLGLAVMDVNIWYPSALIGIITCAMSVAAIYIGKRLGAALGSRMEIVGGIILIALGLKILIPALFGAA